MLFSACSRPLSSHAAADLARNSWAQTCSSFDLSFGVAHPFQHVGESHLPGAVSGATVPCMRTAARAIHGRVSSVETVALPLHAPLEWRPLTVHIQDRTAARQAEHRICTLNKSFAMRLYSDGSQSSSARGTPCLGAAFAAYACHPRLEWDGMESLLADYMDIGDAELHGILLALRSCLSDAQQAGLYWKRIDVFSDS